MANKYEVVFNISNIGSLTVGDALNFLQVNAGSDGYDLANPSTMQAQFLIDETDQSAPFWLGRQIRVTVYRDSDPAQGFNVFTGFVNTVSVEPVDSSGAHAIVSISAASAMMTLQNCLVGGGGFEAETELVRLQNVKKIAENPTWENVPSGLSWLDLPPTTTWQLAYTLFNRNFIIIPTGATSGFSLEAYTDGAIDALTFLQNWASGTGAWIYDNPNSIATIMVFHDDWTAATASNLDVAICAIWDSINLQSDLSNIYTNVTYQNSSASRNYSSFNQLSQFGDRSVVVESQCSNANDLQSLATERGVALSVPQSSLTSITLDCDVLDFTTQKKVMRFEGATFWNLQNVPQIFGGNQTYFQAGISLSLNCYHAEVTLNILPDSVRRGLTQWQEVSYTWTWTNYLTSTTKWSDVK